MTPRSTHDPATPEHSDAELDAPPRHDAELDASPRGDAQADAPPHGRGRLFPRPRWSWNIVAVVCLVAATISLLNSYIDAAFVTATLGVVAWFLEVRNKYKVARVESDETDTDAESEFEEDRDEH